MASQGQRFRRKALRRGYKVEEVDAFLDRAEATIAGEPIGAPVKAQDVRDVAFRVRYNGYDEFQVDLHLDRVEQQLAELEEQGGQAGQGMPAAPRSAAAARVTPAERPGGDWPGSADRFAPGPDRLGPADRMPQHDRMGPPERLGPPDRMGPPDRFAPGPDRYAPGPDHLGGPDRMGPPDRFAPGPDRYAPGPDRLGGPDRMGPPDRFGPGPDRLGDERGLPPRPMPPQPGGDRYGRYEDPTGGFPAGPDAGRGYDPRPAGPPPARVPGPPPSRVPGPPPVEFGSEDRFNGFETGRHGRADMTTEMRMPDRRGPAGPPVSGPPSDPRPMSGPPGSPRHRVEQIRRSFQARRFGSGYDPDQVDRLFVEILDAMAGRGPLPVSPAELTGLRFGLVPGGYFEAEVDAALEEVRDILQRR